MPEPHAILCGKAHIYKRPNRGLWQCSTYLAGKNRLWFVKAKRRMDS